MSIFIGNKEPKEIYIGNKQVKAIYKGSQLIWTLDPEIPEGYVRITLHFNFENAETRQQLLSEGTMASIYYETYTNDADMYDDIGTPYTTDYLYFQDMDSNDNLYLDVVQGDYVQLNVNIDTDKYGSEFSNFNVSYDSLNENVTHDLYVAASTQNHTVTVHLETFGDYPNDDFSSWAAYILWTPDQDEETLCEFTYQDSATTNTYSIPDSASLTIYGSCDGDYADVACSFDGRTWFNISNDSKEITINNDTTIYIKAGFNYEAPTAFNLEIRCDELSFSHEPQTYANLDLYIYGENDLIESVRLNYLSGERVYGATYDIEPVRVDAVVSYDAFISDSNMSEPEEFSLTSSLSRPEISDDGQYYYTCYLTQE